MSRSYRVSVKESVHRVIKAEDRVSTCLEILEVLPPDQMAEILARELEERGFVRKGDVLQREKDGILVTIDPVKGEVIVHTEDCQDVKVEQEVVGAGFDDVGPSESEIKKGLKEEAIRKAEGKIA